MTRKEFSQIAMTLRTAYSTNKDFLATADSLDVWFEMLKDLPCQAASYAVQRHIMTSRWPPTIAEIRRGATPEPEIPNAAAAWMLVRRAARNGLHGSAEEYAALPEPVQRALGDRRTLFDLAFLDDYAIELKQAQFVRAYEIEMTRAREQALLPASARDVSLLTG